MPYHIAIPVRAVFDDAALGLPIHVEEPKLIKKAGVPFKIVMQRPGKVSLQGNAFCDRVIACPNVSVKIIDPRGIVDMSVQRDIIDRAQTIFRYDQFSRRVFFVDPYQDLL